MASLVPYARFVARNPYFTRVAYMNYLRRRRAYRVISKAVRGYRAAKATGIFRGVKRLARAGIMQRRKRMKIGDRVGKATAKRNETINENTIAWDDNTLYPYDILQLGRTSTNEINQRQRDVSNVRGFKLCMEVRNNGTSPLYWNVAVCAVNERGGHNAAYHEDDFFRSYGNERAVAFGDANLGTLDRHCRPINSDKFTILMHKRFKLGPVSPIAYSDDKKSYMNFMRYVPLKRQIRWSDGSTDSIPENANLYLYHWFGQWNKATNVVSTGAATGSLRSVIYFREPKT